MSRNRSLRVLLVTETVLPQVGGGETQTALLAAGLSARGHLVTVLARRSVVGTQREESGDYRILRVGPEGPGRFRKWGLLLTLPRILRQLLPQTDVVVVSGFRLLGLPVMSAAQGFGTPVVLKADSPGEWSGEYFQQGLRFVGLSSKNPLVRRVLNWRNRQLNSAKAFVAMGEQLGFELATGGVSPARIVHIPNGVDLTRFAPVDAVERQRLKYEMGLPEGFVLTFVGRLVRYKGLHALLNAWSRVSAAHPGSLLVIVGEGGNDMESCEHELRALVEAQSLGTCVRFVGAVEDAAPWLRASDGFVFPSIREAFGLALIEAMACGLPVVTTSVGALAPYLQHGQNALIVEPSNTESLSAALQELLGDPAPMQALGHAARQAVTRHFSADEVVKRWDELLSELVGRAAA
ncbi:MAG: glycosyltransferase family 4 protein [Rhodothermales bacterium]